AEAGRAGLATVLQVSRRRLLPDASRPGHGRLDPGAERLLGYTAANILGSQVDVLIPGDAKEEFEDALARLRAGVRAVPYDTWCRRSHGSLIEVAVTLSAMRDAGGKLVGYSALLHDLSTPRRR